MSKELKLIPPSDPRVQTAIAPFNDDMLKEEGFKDRKELVDSMFTTMKKYGGIGMTCNQVGLPPNCTQRACVMDEGIRLLTC